MTEANFICFSQLLFREQGPVLQSLSQFVEPSLLVLITCSLESGTVYQVERLYLPCLGSSPKGFLDLTQCPLIFEHRSLRLLLVGAASLFPTFLISGSKSGDLPLMGILATTPLKPEPVRGLLL